MEGAAAPIPSSMPSAVGTDKALAPGTLPMSKRELKERDRADARAAKERLRAEKADAKKAAKEEKAAVRQPTKDAKRQAGKRPGNHEAAGGSPAAAPASADPATSPARPAASAPDYEKQPHAARNACIVLFLLLLAAVGMVIAAWLGLFRLPSPVQDRVDLLPDLHAQQGKLNAEDSPVAPGSYRLVLNQIPGGDASSRDIAIEFENPAQNTYSARLDLYLDDTGQLVGSTRMVSPGTYLATMALSEQLPPGTYQATAKVGVYSGATQVNTMTAAVELRIEG